MLSSDASLSALLTSSSSFRICVPFSKSTRCRLSAASQSFWRFLRLSTSFSHSRARARRRFASAMLSAVISGSSDSDFSASARAAVRLAFSAVRVAVRPLQLSTFLRALSRRRSAFSTSSSRQTSAATCFTGLLFSTSPQTGQISPALRLSRIASAPRMSRFFSAALRAFATASFAASASCLAFSRLSMAQPSFCRLSARAAFFSLIMSLYLFAALKSAVMR